MMGDWGYGMGLFGGFGMLFGALFWFGLVALVVWALLAVTRRPAIDTRMEDSPLEALKRRYARGEIDRAEFERIRQELR